MSSAFRITQRTLSTSTLAGLQANLAKMQTLQERLSSGRAIQRPSDSPTGTVSALRIRSEVRRADQFERNAQDGLGWLGTADTALTDGLSIVREARDLLLSGQNAALGPNERQALANQVDGLRQSLMSVANSQYLKQPIFAGTSNAPAAFDGTGYQGNNGAVSRSVGPGVKVTVNVTGDQVFGPPGNDIFGVLSDIADDLRNNPSDLTTTDLDRLDAGFLRMQNAVATVGSRYHQIEIMQERNKANQLDATNHLSEVEGVDLPATIVELQLQQVAYQAALGATAKIIQPSLADFLR